MYKAVQTVCNDSQAAWNDLPAFSDMFAEFLFELGDLLQLSYQQAMKGAGTTALKEQQRILTIDKAETIANALRAFANTSGNAGLIGQLGFTRSSFERGGSLHTLHLIDQIIALATDSLSGLSDFGVEQVDIDELVQERNDLELAFVSPRDVIVNRKQLTTEIHAKVKNIDNLLHNRMDQLVKVLKSDHPGFVLRYANARTIVDHKGKTNDNGTRPKDKQDEE